MPVSPLRLDPTRTLTLRRRFAQRLSRQFSRLRSAVIQLIAEEDALGLKGQPLAANQRWRFRRDVDKIAEFKAWLRSAVYRHVLSDEEAWRRYIADGFRKGAGRAFDDVKARRFSPREGEFYRGSKEQFLADSFGRPVAAEKLELLVSRTLEDLAGVTDAMATAMSRVLADGLVQGKGPREVATDLAKQVDGIGKRRAVLISRTELIRSHNEGMLYAMEDLGVEEVGVAVEWLITKDGKVCPLCKPLEGIVLKVAEAHGMLPRHPACRCTFTPANVGEKDATQKKSRTSIEKAIRQSVSREGGEKASKWVGADKSISPDRPESIINQSPELLAFSRWLENARKSSSGHAGPNCGIGSGGFQPGNVCARGGGAGGAAAGKEKFIGQKVGKEEHVHSARVEAEVAKAVGGSVVPREKNKQLPVDVLAKNGDGVEVKSLLKGSKQALSVHDDALLRKVRWKSNCGGCNFHTVAVDERSSYQGGAFKENYSGNRLYYKRGSGRYTLGQMHPVKDAAELKRLMELPTKQLPEKARGSLPPPPPIAKLKESAEKAHTARLQKDRARKARLRAAKEQG